jgi:hypothetical protein
VRSRHVIGFAIAIALHVVVLVIAFGVPVVVAVKKERVQITFVTPPPTNERMTPSPRRERRGVRSEATPNASTPAPEDAPVAEPPSIDLRREPSLKPSMETLLGALDEPSKPTTPLRTDNGRQIIIVDDDVAVAELAESLDGRKLAQGSGDDSMVLRRQRDGTLRYDAKKLTAVIREDGSVRFFEKLDVAAAPGPFVGNGRTAHQNAVGDPTLAEVLRKWSINELPLEPTAVPTLPLMSGTFDITAPLQRLGGNDPLAHEKRCFLDDTRSLRESIAQEHRTLVEARALHALDQQLAAVLDDKRLNLIAKKRAIFELWADCSLENGGVARHRIESFVRAHMPRGSALAFSDDELDDLNSSIDAGERFLPYG